MKKAKNGTNIVSCRNVDGGTQIGLYLLDCKNFILLIQFIVSAYVFKLENASVVEGLTIIYSG
jgi:hypothetical protein